MRIRWDWFQYIFILSYFFKMVIKKVYFGLKSLPPTCGHIFNYENKSVASMQGVGGRNNNKQIRSNCVYKSRRYKNSLLSFIYALISTTNQNCYLYQCKSTNMLNLKYIF